MNGTTFESAEAERLADALALIYACRPEELIRAVGRQLRRGSDPDAANRHVDVVAAEAIANVMDLADCSVAQLPVPEDRSILLANQIAHVQACDSCQQMVAQFDVLRRR